MSFNVPGLMFTGSAPIKSPLVAVAAREKSGKSSCAVTLVDWPQPGDLPLVLAFDPTGPESCAKLINPKTGQPYRVPYLRWIDQPGETYRDKTFAMLMKVQALLKTSGKKPTSLVCDCASTFTESLYAEAQQVIVTKDNRKRYGYVKDIALSFFSQICDLDLPTVWFAWLREQETVQDGQVKRIDPGGVMATGSFKDTLAGRAQQVVLLEKVNAMPNDPNAGSDGAIRRFWTKDYAGIRCEGRYELPNPMPANLAWLFHYIQNRGVQTA